MNKTKHLNDDSIKKEIEILKRGGKTIALCHGVFDLIHPGHIEHFQAAKRKADILIVSLTADQFVNKGPGRPLFNEEIRARSLAAFESIDYVWVSNNSTAIETISLIKPDYYVKGSDYLQESEDITGMIVKERLAVEEYGGSIYFTDEMTSSSSKLINKYFSNYNQNTKQWLDKFRATDGFALTCKYLDLISNLRILVLGETILDQYTYCTPLGKSSKDPILAFRTHDTHVFPGGVLAIANNCAQWAKHVTVNTFIGSNSGSSKFDISMLDKKISTSAITLDSRPTILKHRYVDKISGSRIFEYYDFEPHDLNEDEQSRIISSLRCDLTDVDIVIAADYGHGYFSTEVINEIVTTQNYLAVNTQANAGNRGYNTISKYPRANLISINSGELQLELRNRNPEIEKFVPALVSDMSAEIAIVTLGAGGIQLFNSSGQTEKVPALAEKIVDKVGAGDAVLAISSLLAKVTAPLAVIGFVANLVAAHEVSQLGHQTSLALSDIKKHAKVILG